MKISISLEGPRGVYTGYKITCMDPQQVLNYYFVWSMILNPYLAQFSEKRKSK